MRPPMHSILHLTHSYEEEQLLDLSSIYQYSLLSNIYLFKSSIEHTTYRNIHTQRTHYTISINDIHFSCRAFCVQVGVGRQKIEVCYTHILLPPQKRSVLYMQKMCKYFLSSEERYTHYIIKYFRFFLSRARSQCKIDCNIIKRPPPPPFV